MSKDSTAKTILRVKDYSLEEYEAFYVDTPHGIALAAISCAHYLRKLRALPDDERPEDWTSVHIERLPLTGRNVALQCGGNEAFVDSDGISMRGLAQDLRDALEHEWIPTTTTTTTDEDTCIECDSIVSSLLQCIDCLGEPICENCAVECACCTCSPLCTRCAMDGNNSKISSHHNKYYCSQCEYGCDEENTTVPKKLTRNHT